MTATHSLLQEGRYRINIELPNDRTGPAFEAYDTVSETNVVVKEIPIKPTRGATVSQRELVNVSFDDQAKVLTKIDHDSLLHVRNFFSEAGRQYLVVESVDGDDLQQLLDRQKGSFPISDVAAWADQLLDALQYLHTFRSLIVHRNIRPANIKLNSNGRIKLMGYDILGGDTQTNTGVSAVGSDSSSIAYSPLEQIWHGLDAGSQKVIISKYDERSEKILKGDLDAKSDIYSLGATLYHLLTARQPVDALERSIEKMEGNPDPLISPSEINPTIPQEISEVLMKSMEITREARFDSASMMRQVLRTAFVRIKERDAEELERGEAANDIRIAQNKGTDDTSGQVIKTEGVKSQLQEAEVQRLSAEKRASAAEQKLGQGEVAKQVRHEVRPIVANTDDDLLGLQSPSLHVSNAPKTSIEARDLTVKDVIEKATTNSAVSGDVQVSAGNTGVQDVESLKETKTEMNADVSAYSVRSQFESVAEDNTVTVSDESAVRDELNKSVDKNIGYNDTKNIDAALDEPISNTSEAPVLSTWSSTSNPYDQADTEPDERGGRSLGLPAMAVGAVILCVIAFGGWMLMSSGASDPAKVNQTETPSGGQTSSANPAIQSSTQTADPSTNQPASLQSDPALAETVELDSLNNRVATASTPKLKKAAPTPAKAPTQKKAVTVDDLINDN